MGVSLKSSSVKKGKYQNVFRPIGGVVENFKRSNCFGLNVFSGSSRELRTWGPGPVVQPSKTSTSSESAAAEAAAAIYPLLPVGRPPEAHPPWPETLLFGRRCVCSQPASPSTNERTLGILPRREAGHYRRHHSIDCHIEQAHKRARARAQARKRHTG